MRNSTDPQNNQQQLPVEIPNENRSISEVSENITDIVYNRRHCRSIS